jgi:hypothetical protein
MDLVDIYKIFRPATAQYKIFSGSHSPKQIIFKDTKQVLTNIIKKKETTLNSIRPHRIKLEINNTRNYRQYSNIYAD